MSNQIHPSSVISPSAKIGKDVRIGPFCTVDDHVILEDGVHLTSHVTLSGRTVIGENTQIYPFASLGYNPQAQDKKEYTDECKLIIGKNNNIREYVTMQPGTLKGGKITSVGDHGLFMAGVHVAHDCHIGDHVIMANYATLAGHVIVGDHTTIGGLAAVHQFVRLGHHSYIGGKAGVKYDVFPYALVMGHADNVSGLNLVGLKRSGVSRSDIMDMISAYDEMFSDQQTLQHRIQQVAEKYKNNPRVMDIIDFINEDSKRALSVPAA